MTKIQKARQDFISSIDFSNWRNDEILRRYVSADINYYNREKFGLYHDVMIEFHMTGMEEFVKKWYLIFVSPSRIQVSEEKITNQRANFSVNYSKCSWQILESAKYMMEKVFDKIK